MNVPKARLLSPVFMVVNNVLVSVSITLTLLLPQLATYARWFLWSMLMPSGVLPTLMVLSVCTLIKFGIKLKRLF